MAEKQLTFKENEVIQILNKVYLHFKEGRFLEAAKLLEKALTIDFEYPDVANALKCANFWLDREERARTLGDPYERGEFYLAQWKVFGGFTARMSGLSERCLFTIKYYVFGQALEQYEKLAGDHEHADPEMLLRMGRCHKARGNYEDAIALLEMAGEIRREDPAVLAELADSYSLVNENRAAKVFFREAFYLGGSQVELSYLESPMIHRLVARLRERFGEAEIAEWIPVYGTIYGLFNVRRELRPVELGKLKQSIYQLEKDLQQGQDPRLVPRLLNRYFWLIDHYAHSGEDKQKIEEILARIRDVDPSIYKEYVS